MTNLDYLIKIHGIKDEIAELKSILLGYYKPCEFKLTNEECKGRSPNNCKVNPVICWNKEANHAN